MSEHIFVSNFFQERLGSREGKAPDQAGIGRKSTYCIHLRINGEPQTYTIEQAETALQAMFVALERLIYHADTKALQSSDMVEVVSVRESA